jgi:hypothetical protein
MTFLRMVTVSRGWDAIANGEDGGLATAVQRAAEVLGWRREKKISTEQL